MVRDAEETVQQRGRAEKARVGAPSPVRLFPRPSWTQCCDPFSDTLKGSVSFDWVHEVEVNKHIPEDPGIRRPHGEFQHSAQGHHRDQLYLMFRSRAFSDFHTSQGVFERL